MQTRPCPQGRTFEITAADLYRPGALSATHPTDKALRDLIVTTAVIRLV